MDIRIKLQKSLYHDKLLQFAQPRFESVFCERGINPNLCVYIYVDTWVVVQEYDFLW